MEKRLLPLLFAVVFPSGAFASERSDDLVRRADALDAQLNNSAALGLYLEAEKLDGSNADLLRRVARQYSLMVNDVTARDEKRALSQKGLEYARRAVAIDPKNASAQLALAICYGRVAGFMDNKTKIAYSRLVKEHVDIALALDPGDDYAWHVLGAWSYEMANLNAILRALVKVVYGALPTASNEDAVAHFQKAIELAPQRVAHHIELGRTYAAMGKKDLARAELNKGLALPDKEKDDAETKRRGREALGK